MPETNYIRSHDQLHVDSPLHVIEPSFNAGNQAVLAPIQWAAGPCGLRRGGEAKPDRSLRRGTVPGRFELNLPFTAQNGSIQSHPKSCRSHTELRRLQLPELEWTRTALLSPLYRLSDVSRCHRDPILRGYPRPFDLH